LSTSGPVVKEKNGERPHGDSGKKYREARKNFLIIYLRKGENGPVTFFRRERYRRKRKRENVSFPGEKMKKNVLLEGKKGSKGDYASTEKKKKSFPQRGKKENGALVGEQSPEFVRRQINTSRPDEKSTYFIMAKEGELEKKKGKRSTDSA